MKIKQTSVMVDDQDKSLKFYDDTQTLLARAGAILILLGLLTGGYVSAAMTGALPVDAGAALASHLNAILGGFWIFAVAWSVPRLGYGPTGARRLAWLVIVSNFANWFVTAIKAWLKVKGIAAIGEWKNDAIFGLLTALVVIPSLAAAGAWVWALFRRRT
jgi:(hydroxyamino)benzene mutase